MKTTLSLGQLRRLTRAELSLLGGSVLVALLFLLPLCARAAVLKEARVTQVVKNVTLLPGQAAPRPAAVSDEVHNGTAVRTGVDSRAELTFTDQTLTRLGANTIFSFNEGTRNLQLGGGAMLLRVPKNAGGAKINTAAVTAAITGTTIMLEYHPNAYIKFIVLEGTGRIFRNDRVGESVLVHAGQMLIVNPKGKGLPDPVDVDVNKLMHTSLLVNGFAPLPSENLIAQEINAQNKEKSDGQLITTNLAIFGRGTIVSLLDPTHTDVLDQANANEDRRESPTETPTPTPIPTATVITPTPTPPVTPTPPTTPTPPATPTPPMTPTPTPSITVTPSPTPPNGTPTPPTSPTPSEYGTPMVITSPAPYSLGHDTYITTDPSITTNGHTDYGKIYRGPADDGTASSYFFGSTNAFDTSSGFNGHFSDSANLPVATFKFSSLLLSDNPIISIGNGGTTHLALISVGDITSGTDMVTLTFSGLESLLLATQNGSITIGSNVTFDGIPTLFLYARGANSTLSFDATVAGTTDFMLLAQNNLQFNDTFSTMLSDSSGSGVNIFFDAGHSLTATNGLSLIIDNSDNEIANDADISLLTGGDLTANGDTGLALTIGNSDGTIGGAASIGVVAGGNLTASQISLYINNMDGEIDGQSSIFLNAGGAIQTNAGDVNLFISGDDNGNGGGTFNSDVYIATQAASMSVGGNFTSTISLQGGGAVSSISNTLLLTGALTTTGAVDIEIDTPGIVEDSPISGNVSNDVTIDLTAGSINDGYYFQSRIFNSDGGVIGGNATLAVGVSGDISVDSSYTQDIFNGTGETDAAGEIDGNATNSLTAHSLTADSLEVDILNSSDGFIGGNASITANLSGALTITNDAVFQIDNSGDASIGGDATINVSAASLSAASLLAEINTGQGGAVTGDSNITFTVSGALMTTGDATFKIFRNSGDTTGSIVLQAGSINVGGSLYAGILEGQNRVIFGNVSIMASNDINVTGDLTMDGTLLSAGGDITVGGTLSLPSSTQAGGSLTVGALFGTSAQASQDITINGGPAAVNTLIAGGNINFVNVGGVIAPDGSSSDGTINFTPDDFTITAAQVVSTGPNYPGIASNGSDADPSYGNDNPGNGGNVTLNISGGNGLMIGAANDLVSIVANGGAFASDSTIGGNGGTVSINTSGDVNINDTGTGDYPISATSGLLTAASTPTPLGAGGTVNITSTGGAINVNSTILVSSDDGNNPSPTPVPIRRSAQGGNIHLTSNKATGVAINISNSGQLLALLDSAAPGPGGTITILATGASSEVDVKGTVHADRGTIDIQHTGDGGAIYLGGTSSDFLDAHADVIKVGALGANGELTVGQGSLNADSVLKLYAPGSNGQLNFIANCTLTSGSQAILAAKSITVNNSVVVTIAGNGGQAGIYTDNPNYSGQNGGNNSTTGTFGGNGAANPEPLASAPPLDPTAPGRPGHH